MADDPDEELIERAKPIMAERLSPDGGWCHPGSKEGRAALIRETIRRLQLAKAQKAIEDVMYYRTVLEAFLAEDGLRHGGRPVEQLERDILMARRFRERQPHTHLSRTRLMEQIGESFGVRRSQAIAGINRGLKILSGQSE
jgi:hypothetical protein